MLTQKTIGKGTQKATQLYVTNFSKYQDSQPTNQPTNHTTAYPKPTLNQQQYNKGEKEKEEKETETLASLEKSSELLPKTLAKVSNKVLTKEESLAYAKEKENSAKEKEIIRADPIKRDIVTKEQLKDILELRNK
jgi:hypothetical protein